MKKVKQNQKKIDQEKLRREKESQQEEKFEEKFRSIIEKSIRLEVYNIDDPEQDIPNFSAKALKMLENIWEGVVDLEEEKITLFDVCYENLNLEVVQSILQIEEIETILRHSQLKCVTYEKDE